MPREKSLTKEALELLREWWLADIESGEIAARLGVSPTTVHKARQRLGLHPRFTKYTRRPSDPTPEEIAERARECREKHYADRRNETDECSRIKAWRTA